MLDIQDFLDSFFILRDNLKPIISVLFYAKYNSIPYAKKFQRNKQKEYFQLPRTEHTRRSSSVSPPHTYNPGCPAGPILLLGWFKFTGFKFYNIIWGMPQSYWYSLFGIYYSLIAVVFLCWWKINRSELAPKNYNSSCNMLTLFFCFYFWSYWNPGSCYWKYFCCGKYFIFLFLVPKRTSNIQIPFCNSNSHLKLRAPNLAFEIKPTN